MDIEKAKRKIDDVIAACNDLMYTRSDLTWYDIDKIKDAALDAKKALEE